MAPAPPTTDFEFVRRVTLDLTGRIPTAAAVTSFVNDTTSDKRQKLVDTLMASPEWVDKWTIWFGDFFQNNSRNTQIKRYIQGVVAFNDYIRNSLTSGKPYDQMAREMISATGPSSFTQGELNFIAGGVMGGGPVQDVFDLQAANTAETFLGISHLNCLLCHNGRGHLDSLSLWGYYTTRQQAWGMASFMSRTNTAQTGQGAQPWSLANNRTVDYQLNTTTGNRPARCTVDANGRCVGATKTVQPTYIMDGSAAAGPGLPGGSGPEDHIGFPVRARHGQLHLGILLRLGHREPVEPVRSDAPGSRQSSVGLPIGLRIPARCSLPMPACSTPWRRISSTAATI